MKKMLFVFVIQIILSSSIFSQTDCSITIEKDKFTDNVSIKTQVMSSVSINPIIFGKVIKGKDTTFYLHFYLIETGRYENKGVYVIFGDGVKWQKPDLPVEVSYISSNKYSYRAFLPLSQDDIKRVSEVKITDIKVSAARLEVNNNEAGNLMCGVNKIIETNQ